MKNKNWKTAIWNLSWDELRQGKYNVEGNCEFLSSEGARLNIPFGDISATRTLLETGLYIHSLNGNSYPYIFGQTQDGYNLALCNPISVSSGCSFPGNSYEEFEATTVLSSKQEFDPCALITTIDFEISNLRDWLDITYRRKDRCFLFLDIQEQRKAIILEASEDVQIEIQYGMDYFRQTHESITIPFYCHIHIKYARGKTLDGIWSHELWAIQSMFAFCFGRYPSINKAVIYYENNPCPVEVYRASATVDKEKPLQGTCPVSFSLASQIGLPNFWKEWSSLNKDEKYAVKVLTALLEEWKMPLNLQFIASTTMLESLARSKSKDLYSKEEMEIFRKPILSAADPKIRNRLQGLIELLKHPSYTMLLQFIYDEAKPWSTKLIEDWNKFKKEQHQLRISGAHGIAHNSDFRIMRYHYLAQIILAYYIMLKRLGFSDEQIESFEQSNFLNAARWEIANYYKLKPSKRDKNEEA